MCSREGKVKSVAPAHTAHLDVDLGHWTGTEVWGIFKQLKQLWCDQVGEGEGEGGVRVVSTSRFITT